MTEETKKLFDAPWKAVNDGKTTWDNSVQTSSGYMIACGCFSAESKRLARLPELYDALIEAAGGKCWSCAGENTETMLDHPCPKGHDEDCYVAKWRELLRKVRDGE